MTQPLPKTDEAFGWIDELTQDELLEQLAAIGVDLTPDEDAVPFTPEGMEGPQYQLIPIGDAWLRIEGDDQGRLVAHFVADARKPLVDNGAQPVVFSDESPDLNGWMISRADIDPSGRRWVSVLRRPEREAYVALVYDATMGATQRRLLVSGVYPDVLLLDDGKAVVFVEPDREHRGGQRAVLAAANEEQYETTRRVIADSPTGGIGIRPCSVRRFFKLSRGVRSQRVWDIVDVRSSCPRPHPVPGNPRDPALFDVALLGGEPVIVHGVNTPEQHWMLRVTRIQDGMLFNTWTAASGLGEIKEVTSGTDCALVRVSKRGAESVHKLELDGFSSRDDVLQTTSGILDLGNNRTTPAVGFVATELCGGMEPFDWRWDNRGASLNDLAELRAVRSSRIRGERVTLESSDGYEFDMDIKWMGDDDASRPVILMVYGAYGVDIDLDMDPQLGSWMDRGFAVATPHVRGGGPDLRHRAGTRSKRQRSLDDTAAAIDFLKSGHGPVQAEKLVVIGASAGGFLSATTVNIRPNDVDACVIVNGFVDPLTSLLAGDTVTQSSDRDEWGDPRNNPNDLETLQAISPVENLRAASAKALVIVAACDVRVNPRQGLKWVHKYRALGGDVDLWFDPHGAHDCWGDGMHPDALIEWVCAAIGHVEA